MLNCSKNDRIDMFAKKTVARPVGSENSPQYPENELLHILKIKSYSHS